MNTGVIFINKCSYIWAALCENGSLGICGQRRPCSDCAFAQSDKALDCLPIESLGTIECMNGEQRPGLYSAHARNDLNLRMLKGTFLLDVAHMTLYMHFVRFFVYILSIINL